MTENYIHNALDASKMLINENSENQMGKLVPFDYSSINLQHFALVRSQSLVVNYEYVKAGTFCMNFCWPLFESIGISICDSNPWAVVELMTTLNSRVHLN